MASSVTEGSAEPLRVVCKCNSITSIPLDGVLLLKNIQVTAAWTRPDGSQPLDELFSLAPVEFKINLPVVGSKRKNQIERLGQECRYDVVVGAVGALCVGAVMVEAYLVYQD